MKIIQAAQGRLRTIVSAVALATAALVILVSQSASARPVTPAAVIKTGSAGGPKPSIVLVHGRGRTVPAGTRSSPDSSATDTRSTCRPTRC